MHIRSLAHEAAAMVPLVIEMTRTEVDVDHPRQPLSVVLIEPHSDICESQLLLIRTWGHEVNAAKTGASALHCCETDMPDVVVMELRLPDMDGCEVVRRLRAQACRKRPYVVAATASARLEDRLKAEEAGLDLYLVKPIDPDFLKFALRHLANHG